MKILCVTYRDWAKEIYYKLKKTKKKNQKFYFHFKKKHLKKKINAVNPDYILFYGWSWIIKKNIYKNYKCLMLHPSKLPKFRGGSPIQNQIIRNIKKSGLTIFEINEILDGGDILFQHSMSLAGNLNDIFIRMIKIGYKGTYKIFNSRKIKKIRQNHQNATYFKRRNPKDSEITLQEIKNFSPNYILNKIRMLADPYPNAFIKLKGKKLLIKDFKIV